MASHRATAFTGAQTGFSPGSSNADGTVTRATLTIESPAQHGDVTLAADGGFAYTPKGDEPYAGWDFFRLKAVSPAGLQRRAWVQLFVGISSPYATSESAQPPAAVPIVPPVIESSVEGLTQGYDDAKTLLGGLMTNLGKLGKGVHAVGNAADADVLDKLGDATGDIDAIAEQFDGYVAAVGALATALGKALAEQNIWQWYRSAFSDIAAKIDALPLSVGALSASNKRMKELVSDLSEQGEGAAVAVDLGNRVVRYAEGAHNVLSTAQMAGGLGVLAQTGATLLVKEGLKACAKQAAKGFMQQVASSVAANLVGRAANLAGVPTEYQSYVSIGLDAYGVFSMLKAARTKINWNGNCFVAGTGVLSGIDVSGQTYRRIEDLRVGDTVLSRDQSDDSDDLSPHRVSEVFRRTSDHLRVLTIRDADGNVETVRTTDEHPFYVPGLGWTAAGELARGQRLSEADGTDDAVVVSSVREEHPEGITVYNFTVEGDHTYFVEDGQGDDTAVWVHNTCDFKTQTPRNNIGRQTLGRQSDSRILRRNLKNDGVTPPASAAAHHIVAGGDPRAGNAKAVLDDLGIDINQASNGVFLPIDKKRMVPGLPTHSQIHTSAY